MRPGPQNHLLDVAGLSIGHAHDAAMKSGVTVIVPDRPAVASVAVGGGAPGTRETDLLAPERTVERIDAVVLAGGSAFGLTAADGVQAELAARGLGLPVQGFLVPIVPAAIVFDLAAGGVSDHERGLRYRTLGREATAAALAAGGAPTADGAPTAGRVPAASDTPADAQTGSDADTRTAIGSVGVGLGCRTAGLKGGFGSASTRLQSGILVGAAVAVNAIGSVVFGEGPHFRAAPFERAGEFGGLGLPPSTLGADRIALKQPAAALGNTVIAVVATDAALDKNQARHLARIAHDGIALAVWPAHTPLDGDTIFAIATGGGPRVETSALLQICAAATATLARAIARGVYAAAADATDPEPTWRARFGALNDGI